ncbi:MAG: hypothetical protein QOF14_5939 [Hyphomicrobiales bacterium]|jgi:hypothetical protein|nr:hypothetical protein [Hyphomicrobiales bacterium]
MHFQDLPTSDDGVSAFMDAWCRAFANRTFQRNFEELTPKQVHELYGQLYDQLYKNLDSLDTKASALLNACAIVASINIFLTQYFLQTSRGVPILIVGAGILAILAFLVCTYVVRVQWTAVSKLQRQSFPEALREFVKTRNKRTWAYIASWWGVFVAVLMMLIHLSRYLFAAQLTTI